MGDQGFSALQCMFFRRRRGQRIINLVRASRYALQALFDDPQALTCLVHLDHTAAVSVVVVGQRYLEPKVLVTGVEAGLVQVEVAVGDVQADADGTLFGGFPGVVPSDADGPAV